MSSCVVLLSGGQDSTTCLYWSKIMFDTVHAISIRYGQRHIIELDAAQKIAILAGVASHEIYDLSFLAQLSDSALITENALKAEGGLPDKETPQGLPTSFVPGRNAIFLLLASLRAIQLKTNNIVIGVCQTDYSGYPDCREAFVTTFEKMIAAALPSSIEPLRVHTPLMHLTKSETVSLAQRLPGCFSALGASVTCYFGKRPGCGGCPACVLRAQGFAQAGVTDPAGF